ncbi:MAG TPA: Clp protease N-terminal domain-containing protein, partial [Chloroflexia bacterium]|nr:Clp protease N-terminal domain-containing protein [Chloroflexia bacterium]
MPSNGFTEGAQGALRAAQEIVQQKGHTQLDVEHILLALLTPRDSLVAQLVTQLRGDPEALARRLDDQLNSIPPDPQRHTGLAQIHISQRAQRVVSGAAEEADKLHDTMIGVEHLFLAIAAEPEGPAAQMLGEVLIDQAAIYRLLAEMRSAVSWSKPAPAAGAMAPGRPQGKLSGGFTDQAQEALRTAQEIVQQKRHSQLDVEHILLALLKLPTGLISRILEQLSADPSILVQRLDEQLNAG